MKFRIFAANSSSRTSPKLFYFTFFTLWHLSFPSYLLYLGSRFLGSLLPSSTYSPPPKLLFFRFFWHGRPTWPATLFLLPLFFQFSPPGCRGRPLTHLGELLIILLSLLTVSLAHHGYKLQTWLQQDPRRLQRRVGGSERRRR
jgi:hypothetical protein